MRILRVRYSVLGLMILVAACGLAMGGYRMYRARATNRAIARKQVAEIDNAWERLKDLGLNARIEIDGGTIGPWGGRKLEALHRAGAGKAEIVAALEKHIKDLELFESTLTAREETFRAMRLSRHEVKYLRMEAEIWLNEEKAR